MRCSGSIGLPLSGRNTRIFYKRLARIHVFAPRLPLMHRVGYKGPFSTSQFDFAWFVWEAAPPIYGTVIDRVNWRKL